MARNGSGTYSLPQDPFVFDTVIEETKVNSNFSDIATEITNSIDKDGQTPITGILQHSVAVGQTANTGSVQGNNPITTEFYEISVCANAGDAVTLPTAKAGQLVIIVNNGANSADVFPASGDKIDGGSANAAFALAAGANALFICQDATDWDTLGGGFFTPSSTTTLSNKTIDLDANTVTGTLAEFNTALQSESFASLGGSETLVSKTLTAPVLNDPTFDVSVGVTAHTGSSQGDGAITATFVEIAVCANAGDAVTLPGAAAGKLVVIANNGANSADVFPASGDKIDGGSANVAVALPAGQNRIYICQDATDWDTVGGVFADSVSGASIVDDAIDSEHYVDGSIDAAHIASNAVTTVKINADAVTGAKIADDSIDSEHYLDGSIDNAHIADDAIDSEHYVDGSIDTAHIADNAVRLAKMAGGTDGTIITFDASGNPTAVGPGSDGQVLTSTGAGSPPAFEAVAAGGKLVQVVHAHEGAVATGTTIAPTDDTILQNSEGTEWTNLALAITPTSSSNKLIIEVVIYLTTAGTKWHVTGLFQDTTANALACCRFYQTSQVGGPSVIRHYMTAGTTSSTTFKVRSGPHASDTITLNGELGNRNFGGVFSSTIVISEIAV